MKSTPLQYPRKTKIIATVGPACRDEKMLKKLLDAGVNLFRFNFSHAQQEHTQEILTHIRTLLDQGFPIATILDTKGPEIRSGDVDEPVQYLAGDTFEIVVDRKLLTSPQSMFCDYQYFAEDVHVGQQVIIDSGLLNTTVLEKTDTGVLVQAENQAVIKSRRHINLPGVKLRLPALTEKDKKDLLFGIDQKMDFVAVSFVRNQENVQEVRDFLDAHGGEHIRIISKIENQEGVENIEQIAQQSDAVMIARGDLGVEIPIVSLPGTQQHILNTCIGLGTPIIYATELLKSMVDNVFPTRSEVSDVYHAVANGCDVVMLSDETANGSYPVESVTMLASISVQAEQERCQPHIDFSCSIDEPYWLDKKYSILAAHELADNLNAKAIIIFTDTGFFASIASAFKPNVPVYAFTASHETFQYLHILGGVLAQYIPQRGTTKREDELTAIDALKQQGILEKGDKVVVAYDADNTEARTATVKIENLI